MLNSMGVGYFKSTSCYITIRKLCNLRVQSSKRFNNEGQHIIVFTTNVVNFNALLKGFIFFEVYGIDYSKQTKSSQEGNKILTMGKMWVL
jgi:hypothetical protein